jgi:DNA-binding response OmpR family regulator
VGSILLVEADPKTRDAWAAALMYVGHAVVEVATTDDALPAIREGGIDLVVIDVDLRSVVDLAKNVDALPDAPPIVLVSRSPDAPEVSVRIGVAAFLPKPCEPSELVSAVNRLVGPTRPVQVFEDEPTGPNRTYG